MPKGIVYLLPVPISKTDIGTSLPEHTIKKAKEIRFFLAENAKSARAFLKQIDHPIAIRDLSINEIGHRPDGSKIDSWLEPIKSGNDIAIISEAGCPGIADPGAQIVSKAHKNGIRVVPLVGPCSLILALMASGMNGQRFRFCGYLPIKDNERMEEIRKLEKISLQSGGETELFIETPYRNNSLLEILTKVCRPTTLILVACDITGSNELIVTKTATEWKKHSLQLPKEPTVFGLVAQKL